MFQRTLSWILIFFSVSISGWARGGQEKQRLAVSQGISAPTTSSAINWKSGFVYSNAGVAASYDGALIALEYDTNEDTDDSGTGAELGVGTGTVGLGLGYYKRSCDGCEEQLGILAGYSGGSWTVGLGSHDEDTQSLGLLFDLGSGRLGLAVDQTDNGSSSANVTSYGIGYSYIGSGFILALDVSKSEDGSSTTNNDVILVTPGILVDVSQISLSVSFDSYMNDDSNTRDDEAWVGLGYNDSNWNLNVYKDFIGDWAVNFVYQF